MRRAVAPVFLIAMILLSACAVQNDAHAEGALLEKEDQSAATEMQDESETPPQHSNEMGWVDGQLYYFDEDGEIDPASKWRKVNDLWYYIGADGYALRNCWSGTHFLLDDGVMATDQYVDRFYIGAKGTWANNNWKEGNWKIDGSWYSKDGTWYFENTEGEIQVIDTGQIRSISRLVYNTVAEDGYPQQSLAAYEAALEHGFRILLCDLRFTADGVPVCFHDSYINERARNLDGSDIVTLQEGEKLSEEQRIKIEGTPFEELNGYDYGISKGEQYAGATLLTFRAMLDFCKEKQVDELYVEIKSGTEEQIQEAVKLTKSYGIKISWAGSTYDQVKWVIETDPTARVSLMPYNIDEALIDELCSLQTGQNEVFIFAFGNAILTPEIVEKLQSTEIAFEMGTINSEREILNYWNGAYHYCSGIESDLIVASDIDIGKVLEVEE